MNLRMTLAVAFACSFQAGVFADDADAKLLRPFVTPQTAAVAMLDLSSAEIAPAVKAVLSFLPDQAAAEQIGATIEKLRAADVKRLYLVVAPQSLSPHEWVFALAATSAQQTAAVRAAFPTLPETIVAEKDGAVFFGDPAVWRRLEQAKSGDDAQDLLRRIDLSKSHPLSVVARLPEALRGALAELAPRLPRALGGGSTASLLSGFDGLELHAATGDRPSISVVVHARDAAAAKELEALVAKGLVLAQQAPPRATPSEKAARSLAVEFKPAIVDNRLELSLDLAAANLQAGLKGLADVATENARRHKVTNDLRRIALAMHNYHDANKSFPPGATVDKSGKPLLSWRVQILPFLDQKALYQKFKLDEPWDSDHNRKLIDQMPDSYAGFGPSPKDGKTAILGFAGAGALFPRPGESVRIDDIKDGTSNTIMCIAAPASQAVVWTKPDDLSLKDADLLAKVGVSDILAAYCDGSVHSIPMPPALKGLLPYITINGRDVIGE